jgi:hypothetical protein
MGVGASSGAADQLARAHARLLQDHDLQFAFAAAPAPPKPPDWLKPLAELIASLAPLLQWVFWGGLALAVAAILFFIGRELVRVRWPARHKPVDLPAPEAWRPAPERARALLEDADALAAAGRYGDAARLLLHRSIDDLESRRPRAVRPALTARDIARLEALPAPARGPFALIAAAVEKAFFAGRELDAAGFAECRRAYEAYAFPEAWA